MLFDGNIKQHDEAITKGDGSLMAQSMMCATPITYRYTGGVKGTPRCMRWVFDASINEYK